MMMVKHDIPQPNNFNIIRLLLAVLVFLSHFFSLAGQHNGVMIIDAPDMVRGFFVISGFLIYSSYCRSNTLKSYFIKRARRILPSYIFVVLLCAFGLVFVSTLPASEYFGTDWLKYLFANLTFANFAHPTLPGVFADNYHTAVNGSLWSIKVEIMVYLALPLLVYMCKKLKANHNVFFIIVILLSIVYTFICDTMYSNTGEGKYLMQNTIQKAVKQSRNVIVDLRRAKRPQERCLQELEKEFDSSKSLQKLKVITKSRKILDFEK